jgi:diguanylate cyclase (GGDEF)-like protein
MSALKKGSDKKLQEISKYGKPETATALQQKDADGEQVAIRVLVVDDDPLVRDIIVESVQSLGYSVDWSGNGLEALERNSVQPYDLIVTDMLMPGLDGLTLTRNISLEGSKTDVVVITGFGSIENAVECMKAGALDYLIKPFTIDQIQLAVKKAIEHRELTARAKERDLYRQMSYEDPLTGVYNRRFFDEALKLELVKANRHKTPVLLFMIDIDYFKVYNDLMGHVNGDEALCRMATVIKAACRGYDIVTRYGGEEFAVIFPGAGKSEAAVLADRIMENVRSETIPGAQEMPFGVMTVSIGAAGFPDDATNHEDLVRCADQALYSAKKGGRNKLRVYRGKTPLVPPII